MKKKFFITAFFLVFAVCLIFTPSDVRADEAEVRTEHNEGLPDEEAAKAEMTEETADTTVAVEEEAKDPAESEVLSEPVSSEGTEAEVPQPEEETEAEEEESEEEEDASEKVTKRKPSFKKKAKKVKKEKKSPPKTQNAVIRFTDEEFKMLACTIFVEAGNQPFNGKVAVANVVINRVKSKLFPNSIKDVIYQKTVSRGRIFYQFAIVKPGGTLPRAMAVYGKRRIAWEKKAEAECIKAAKAALYGEKHINDDHFFFMVTNRSIKANRPNGKQISAHYFYR